MSQVIHRRLGYILPRDDGRFDAIVTSKSLDNDSIEELKRETRVVLEIQRLTISFDTVYQNFCELRQSQDLIARQLDSNRAGVAQVSPVLHGLVKGAQRAQNFLTSANSFLAIAQVAIESWGARYPDAPETWNERRKDHHAEFFAYRFLYELRNYSQHYGLPISGLEVSATRESPDADLSFSTKLSLKQNDLLEGSYPWKNLAGEIRSQPNSIELLPLAEQYFKCLRDLFDLALYIRRQEMLSCAEYFKAIDRLLKLPDGGMPVIFKGENIDDSLPPAEFDVIPYDQLKWILDRVRECREVI